MKPAPQDKSPRARASAKNRPRYQEVAKQLVADIDDGRFAVGSMLPTELELCERFGVSRFTVREALRRLHEMGMVSRRQGSGTVVEATRDSSVYMQTVGSMSEALQYPRETYITIVDTQSMICDGELAEQIRVEPGTERMRVSTLRRLRGSETPIAWTDVYVLPKYADTVSHHGTVGGPLYEAIERTYGEYITEVEMEASARLMPSDLAKHLKVDPGTPALVLVRHYVGRDGTVFETSVSTHAAGRFTYSMRLQRQWTRDEI